MAQILTPTKALTVNPLKASQPIGASLAFLGLAECMPLEHGARGCASFNKLFFMRHFNEPIPLQTTAMDQTTTILGADASVVEALATICRKNQPKIIGLVTTGLSEMQGADVLRTVQEFRRKHPEFAAVAVAPASASDTLGCLETGFAAGVESIIRTLVPRRPQARKNPRQVNVLAGAMLTPGDLEKLREWIEAFGLTPIIVPDIGASLDGHLIDAGYSTLTYGGVSRAEIETMGESIASFVIGRSLSRAADALKEITGVPDWRFDQLIGLAQSDAFTQTLVDVSGKDAPVRLARKREQLTDAMVDCQFQFGGARIGVAGDADVVGALADFFMGMGSHVVAAVASANSPRLDDLAVDSVVIGDLEDFETLVIENGVDLIVANSHGGEISRRTGAALLRAGFPIYDAYGAQAEAWIGYGGTRQLIFTAANLLSNHYQELRPYVSRFRAEAAE
ncbi:nitrogenase iron-molybdenum cofactor biosynthesis protein NifN [Methylocystis bryophila]|uniref:Nitrogenase iron-molybdenum cofactor biosynthesis protein NifN n=1 Tax=Methylocystis bryophila TaxID=655015 RepID=A0A1W6MTI0_9HYPH|nr:nitrogenase iron-molybdenum cofactor biosynthesis protein NifN [Methylocystis bryophila]ARN80799.1 nitrogenase iron-molybdenum cofactor biosynthesis protein NifN [Methylocystis bryophila]BDV40882.1 nitrogenase molybdenum-cofactor biosynthesis protein NifN [Methylocystis bryophila]